jgi:hypothetical protein
MSTDVTQVLAEPRVVLITLLYPQAVYFILDHLLDGALALVAPIFRTIFWEKPTACLFFFFDSTLRQVLPRAQLSSKLLPAFPDMTLTFPAFVLWSEIYDRASNFVSL